MIRSEIGTDLPGPAVAALARVEDVDATTGVIIGSAIEVQRVIGPGLLESAYELALCIELEARGVPYLRQVRCPIVYRGVCVGDYRLDLVVSDLVVAEISLCGFRGWLRQPRAARGAGDDTAARRT